MQLHVGDAVWIWLKKEERNKMACRLDHYGCTLFRMVFYLWLDSNFCGSVKNSFENKISLKVWNYNCSLLDTILNTSKLAILESLNHILLNSGRLLLRLSSCSLKHCLQIVDPPRFLLEPSSLEKGSRRNHAYITPAWLCLHDG